MEEQGYYESITNLARTINNVETNYYNKKLELDCSKAEYILQNDWEQLLGKAKPTQKEKEAWIEVETREMKAQVNQLKITAEYLKRLYEVKIVDMKIRR